MNKQVLLCGLFFSFLSVVGCASPGVSRTPLDLWEHRSFDDIGIAVDIPSAALMVRTLGVEKWEEGVIDSCDLKFYLHMLRSSGFADSFFFIHFDFMRLTSDQYQDFREGKHSETNYGIWGKHHSQEYTNVTFFAWDDFNYGNIYGWRRDYRADNGDVVVAGVSYMPLVDWDDEMRAADSNAVVRILNSVVVD